MLRWIWILLIPLSLGASAYAGMPLRGIIQPAREAALSFGQAEIVTELPKAGEAFAVGSVIARQDARQSKVALYQSEMDVEMASVALATAAHEKAKKERLLKQNIVAPIAVEEAGFRHQEAQARLKSAQARYRLVELQLADNQLTAPFDGIVKAVHSTIGEQAQPGKPIIEFMETDNLEVRLDLPLAESSGLLIGAKHSVRVGSEVVGEAIVSQIQPFLDPASGTQRVVWSIVPSPELLTGRYVTLVAPQEGDVR